MADDLVSLTMDCGCRVMARGDRVAAAICGLHSMAQAMKRILGTIVMQLDHDVDQLPPHSVLAFESLEEARDILARADKAMPDDGRGLKITCCGLPLEESSLPDSSVHDPDGGFQLFNLVCEICGATYNLSGAPGEEEAEAADGGSK